MNVFDELINLSNFDLIFDWIEKNPEVFLENNQSIKISFDYVILHYSNLSDNWYGTANITIFPYYCLNKMFEKSPLEVISYPENKYSVLYFTVEKWPGLQKNKFMNIIKNNQFIK